MKHNRYISEDDFLKVNKSIMMDMLNWYNFYNNDNDYDLICLIWSFKDDYKNEVFKNVVLRKDLKKELEKFELYASICIKKIPLFTDVLLREYIEEKVGGIISSISVKELNHGYKHYTFIISQQKNNQKIDYKYECISNCLLSAYWNIACMISEDKSKK